MDELPETDRQRSGPRSRRWRMGVPALAVAASVLLAAPPLGSGSRSAAERGGRPGAASADAPRPTATAAGPASCPSDELRVVLGEARAVRTGYDFEVHVISTADAPCDVDLGEDLSFTVTTGTERVHRSVTCGEGSDVRPLAPGARVRTTLHWSGRMRADGGCADAGPAAPDGYYVARARIGARSDTSVLLLD
jgi:hypothetical protein